MNYSIKNYVTFFVTILMLTLTGCGKGGYNQSAASSTGSAPVAANVVTSKTSFLSVANLNNGLGAYYNLDGNANDSSGNGNNGIVSGATQVAGKVGEGYLFNGSGDNIAVSSSPSVKLTAAATINFWVNANDTSGAGIVSKRGPVNEYQVYYYQGQMVVLFWGLSNIGVFSNSNPVIGSWEMWTATYDGTAIRLYKNGVLDASVASSGNIDSAAGDLWLGNDHYGHSLNGVLDDVRIYSRALSAAEVQELYNYDIAASCRQVAAGYYHTAVVTCDGAVLDWGYNASGQLGYGSTSSSVPGQVAGLTGMISVAAGADHTLALKNDGTVWAWGGNYIGQLGDGTTNQSTTPVLASGLTGVTAVAAGNAHSVALKNDGTVWAWGYNGNGQLGYGFSDSATPGQVPGLTGVTAIAAGSVHTVALKTNGTVLTWGDNYYGQLGDGTLNQSTIPVQVPGLTGVTAIAAGYYYTVALRNDGTVWTWGRNDQGQLGNGSFADSALPVQVSGLSGATAVAAGALHAVALKNDTTVWGWGHNGQGQQGDGTMNQSTIPVQVSGLTGVIDIAAGYYHTVALKNDKTLWSWGYNGNGQLGNGTFVSSNVPVQGSIQLCAQNVAVSFIANVGGSITGATSQTVSYGGSTTAVSAVPDLGYHFVNWTGDNGFLTTTVNPLVVSGVTVSQNITANFAVNTFAVNFTSGGNGTLTGPTAQIVNYNGSTAPVTAVPAAGYYFVNWTGTGGFVTTAANPLTVLNVTASQTITANFAPTPATQVTTLATTLDGFNLPAGSTSSLGAKLNTAIAGLAAGNTTIACNALGAFINETSAQSGKKLSTAQSSQLIADAQAVKVSAGCP